MAYVLGFFAADGTMIRNKRGGHFIEFHINDKEILIAIRKATGSNHKISVRIGKNPRQKVGYRIQFGSKEMYNDLLALGMCPRKSLALRMPAVPTKYFGDFVRGYFDGDGCVYYSKLKFADRKNPRKILMTMFTSGCKDFLSALHSSLKQYGIQGGSLHGKGKAGGFDLSFSFRDSLALYQLMYNTGPDTGFHLPRKYKIFQKAIRNLYPEMRV